MVHYYEVLGARTSQTSSDQYKGNQDRLLIDMLDQFTKTDQDYWSFRKNSLRTNSHGLSHYPAMMVPSMQEVLLKTLIEIDPKLRTVYDPFVGSGTTLVESMRNGLDFFGQDINPLAILISKVKTGPFQIQALQNALDRIKSSLNHDRSTRIEIEFSGIDKWFTSTTQIELSKIRRAILKENNFWCRRVFWLCLAEVVRVSSNSRTSTYKLHTRSKADLLRERTSALELFITFSENSIALLHRETELLRCRNLLTNGGFYKGKLIIEMLDTTKLASSAKTDFDLVLTSPPYGDNHTTVPYGQFSYLPLCWTQFEDICDNLDGSILTTLSKIDSISLGGLRQISLVDKSLLVSSSYSLELTLNYLENVAPNHLRKVIAFFRDLNLSLGVIVKSTRPNAYMVWTVGNRRVGGHTIPMDKILIELLFHHGVNFITEINRQIANKRMASKNNFSPTMRCETVLVFRKV